MLSVRAKLENKNLQLSFEMCLLLAMAFMVSHGRRRKLYEISELTERDNLAT